MNIVRVVTKGALQLMKIGTLTTVNTWTNQEVRNTTNHFIGEVKRGADHSGRKLGLIKND